MYAVFTLSRVISSDVRTLRYGRSYTYERLLTNKRIRTQTYDNIRTRPSSVLAVHGGYIIIKKQNFWIY